MRRCWICACLFLAIAAGVHAHEPSFGSIQHNLLVRADARNVDVEVELTFGAWQSLRERRTMDDNGDGTISPDEQRRYLERLTTSTVEGLRLAVGGRALTVTTLYEPQLDLGATRAVGPVMHTLRLWFFARTPTLDAGPVTLAIDDRLWRTAPGTGRLHFRATPPLSMRGSSSEQFWVREDDAPRAFSVYLSRTVPETNDVPASRPATVPLRSLDHTGRSRGREESRDSRSGGGAGGAVHPRPPVSSRPAGPGAD